MRGIVAYGSYLPAPRVVIDGAKKSRITCSYDEDTTTMAVEAARAALRTGPAEESVTELVFVTTTPAYMEKANATAIHAALSLPETVLASDAGASVRSSVAALRSSLTRSGPVLVVAADIRAGLPGSADERAGRDGAAALIVGDVPQERVLAEHLGSSSRTVEFLDRWRLPGERHVRSWEERFGYDTFLELAAPTFRAALSDADLGNDDVARLLVTGWNARAVSGAGRAIARECANAEIVTPQGDAGAASGFLELTRVLDKLPVGQVVAWLSLGDGVDVELFRARDPLLKRRGEQEQPARELEIGYLDYLTWRGELAHEPPRRPDPPRPAGPPSRRSERWKFGLVGSACAKCGQRYAPPQRRCVCGAVDDMVEAPLRDVWGTVATFTLDYLAYSPHPPIIAAAVDLDGGGRMQCQLTDVAPGDVKVGDRVAMTFRRLYTSEYVHNYFWKARPVDPTTTSQEEK